jgi:hypothetical protein
MDMKKKIRQLEMLKEAYENLAKDSESAAKLFRESAKRIAAEIKSLR